MKHVHDYSKMVRRKGNRARWQCVCLAISPWDDIVRVPPNNPVALQRKTVAELRHMASVQGITGTSRMTKAQIVDRLTEIT